MPGETLDQQRKRRRRCGQPCLVGRRRGGCSWSAALLDTLRAWPSRIGQPARRGRVWHDAGKVAAAVDEERPHRRLSPRLDLAVNVWCIAVSRFRPAPGVLNAGPGPAVLPGAVARRHALARLRLLARQGAASVPAVGDHSVASDLGEGPVEGSDRTGQTGDSVGAAIRRTPASCRCPSEPVAHGGRAPVSPVSTLGCIAAAPTPEATTAGQAPAAAVVRAMAPWSEASLVPSSPTKPVETSFFDDADWVRLATSACAEPEEAVRG